MRAGGYIEREAGDRDSLCRDVITLVGGQHLAAGTVMGRVLTPGAAVFVGTVGTRGAVTVAAAVGQYVQAGVYQLKCVSTASNAGTFQLRAPDGSLVPFDTALLVTVAGGAFTSDHLGITIAGGATDFSVGDRYQIEVTASNVRALDPSATDGTQIACLVIYDTGNDEPDALATTRFTDVRDADLVWPESITAAQKSVARSQLARRGIVVV